MKGNIQYKEGLTFSKEDIKNLYEDAKWSLYTDNMDELMKAITNSLKVITAWDKDKLVGLIRVVGDGVSIIYIQDILVLKSYKRKGIGGGLIEKVLKNYSDVRQKVLLTDDTEETRGFYESIGFKSCDNGGLVAFVNFD
ncbi:GNAT family N-acetyltransferase [Dethiothermospora halolimnae]|uniref:GNAT family N-acetyltransferase n=1 Tax=Dethiothermospora halolimnae TaxID=3114390 RepID=UPI003CCBC3E0